MKRSNNLLVIALLIVFGLMSCNQVDKNQNSANTKPNILWLYVEDLSPLFGCYGAISPTPVVDELAKKGVLFQNAFATTAVCSPTRSALITGMMPTTIGAHNHRSYVNDSPSWVELADTISTLPKLFQDSGYFTFNQHYDGHQGKEDYNFYYVRDKLYENVPEKTPADSSFWQTLISKQPFFGQIQMMGGKGSNPEIKPDFDMNAMKMLPYYPSTPFFRKMYAVHHMQAERTDKEIGKILNALRENGLLKNTIIFFFTDHGWKDGIRHKQFCYDGGLHVPLVVYWEANPDAIHSGKQRSDLVSLIDVSASSLALANIVIPDYMEGKNLFDDEFTSREYVIGTRDRMDYTIDHIRTVRTERYRYIRNYMPERPYLQPQYRDTHAFMVEMKRLYKEEQLNDIQSQFFVETKPEEEFYDHLIDPYEIHNLIDNPKYKKEIDHHRKILIDWIKETNDKGQYPESEVVYETIYKRWGDKCVNPEYDKAREKLKR